MSNEFWHPHEEKCGFILKDGTVIHCENMHPDPSRGFTISQEEIDKYIGQAEAIWHSHPRLNLNLSVADYLTFLNYPSKRHRIYGLESYAEYYVRNGLVLRTENDFTIS